MLVTPPPIVMLASELQPLNALLPMLVTLSGIIMLVKPLQYENAPYNMLPPVTVTLLSDDGI